MSNTAQELRMTKKKNDTQNNVTKKTFTANRELKQNTRHPCTNKTNGSLAQHPGISHITKEQIIYVIKTCYVEIQNIGSRQNF